MSHGAYCTDAVHESAYCCVRCRQNHCATCDKPALAEIEVKTIVRYCQDWRCQREKQLEEVTLDTTPRSAT